MVEPWLLVDAGKGRRASQAVGPDTARPLGRFRGSRDTSLTGRFQPMAARWIILEHDLNADSTKNMVVLWNLAHGPENPVPGAAPIVCAGWPTPRMADGWLRSRTGKMVTLRDTATGQPIKTFADRSLGSAGTLLSRRQTSPPIQVNHIWDTSSGRELGSVRFDGDPSRVLPRWKSARRGAITARQLVDQGRQN